MPSYSNIPGQKRADAEAARQRARRDLIFFCRLAMRAEGTQPAAHHLLLLRELAMVARGTSRRLMVFMPPGSAKSTYASVLFPSWFLAGGWNPARQRGAVNVLAASHTAALAESFGRRVRGDFAGGAWLGWKPLTSGAAEWATTRGGRYRAVGVGAGIAGYRADLGVIDDPVRNRADADSRVVRDRIWNWYRSDFLSRLRPGGRQVLVMTRWHEDDLAGRLLASDADAWRVVRLPALAGDNDPLGRAPGAALWDDDDYGYAAQLKEIRAFYERVGGLRDWYALYQQEPRPLEGGLFRVVGMPLLDAVPPGQKVRGWDLAATAADGGTDPDWTAGVLMLRTESGGFVVEDVVRLRGGPEAVKAALLNTAARDGRDVVISLPQDPGQAGKAQAADLVRCLAGYRVQCSPESGSKPVRAAPLASQANIGNVAVLRASWTMAFLDELRGFPGGGKDDQVDAASRAFNLLAGIPAPARAAHLPIMAR